MKMGDFELKDLGWVGALMVSIGTGVYTFLKWNRTSNLEDQENRLKEVRNLVTVQTDRIKVLEADLSKERQQRLDSERKCDERIDELSHRLAAADTLNGRLEERVNNYEDALTRAKIPFKPFDPNASDRHRPLPARDRRTGTKTDTGERRRREDGE